MEFLGSFHLRRRLEGTSSDEKFLLFPQASSSCQVLNLIQLFRERLSEKVHATTPKGIMGG